VSVVGVYPIISLLWKFRPYWQPFKIVQGYIRLTKYFFKTPICERFKNVECFKIHYAAAIDSHSVMAGNCQKCTWFKIL